MANLIDAIKILITGDGSGLRTDLQQSEAEVEKLHEVLETPIPTTGIDGYVKNIQIMAGNVQTAEEKVKELQDRLQQPLSEEQIKALETELQQAMHDFDSAIKSYDMFKAAVAGNLDDAGIKQLNEDLRATQEEINQTKAKFDELRGVSPKGSGEEGGLFSMQGQMDTLYGGMALGAVALPMDAGIKDAIKTFGDFDQAIANVNSMAGYTPEQLDKIKKSLEDMSKTVPDGPVALANALYGIIGAGVPAADAMGVLQTASKAAAAGQTDVSTATNALIAVMNSYGMSAKDVGQISDQMFAANAAGAMTFTEFAKSVGTVAGPAAQVGVSFDQVAAATAALTNQGISAQRATMGLRALLMGIAAPTAGATKEAQKLGIQWDTNALQSKGLTGMMQEAMKATGGNTQELKKLIPNIAAWTVATDLGGKGAQSYTQAMQTMKDSVGATDKAVRAQDEGLTEQTDHMKASFQTLQIQLVQAFAPALEKVIDSVTRLINWFNNLSPQNKAWIADIALVVAGLTTLGSVALGMISGLGALAMAFNAIKTALFGVSAAEEVVEATTVAVESTNPIGWIMLAIAGLIMLVTYIVSHWSEIKAWLVKTWTEIHDVAVSTWGKISSFFANTWGAIRDKAESIWGAISDFFKKWGMDILYSLPLIGLVIYVVTHWTQIKTETVRIWGDITSWLKNTWNDIVTSVSNFFGGIGNFFSNLWNGVETTTRNVWNSITSFFTNTWGKITGMFQSAYSYFADPIQRTFFTIQELFHGFGVDAKVGLEAAWNTIKTIFYTAVLTIYYIFTGQFSKILPLWQNSLGMIHDFIQGFVVTVETTFRVFGSNLENTISAWWGRIKALWDTGVQYVETTVSNWWTNTKKEWTDGIKALEDGLSKWWEDTKKSWAQGWDDLKKGLAQWWTDTKKSWSDGWDDTKKGAAQWWTDTKKGFADGWKNLKDGLAQWWSDTKKSWSDGWDNLKKSLSQAWRDFVDGVKTGAVNVYNAAVTGFQKTIKWFEDLPNQALQWAENMVDMFAQGIRNEIKKVEDAAHDLITSAEDFLGFHSPTRKGPGSTADQWAPNFVKMYAQGLAAGAPAVAAASQQLVQPLADAFGGFSGVTKDQLPQVKGLLDGIVNAKKEYQIAQKKGDEKGMEDAHANADKYRAMLQQMGIDTTNFGADQSLQETMLARSQAMAIATKAAEDLVAKQKEQLTTEKDLATYEDQRNKILDKQAEEIKKIEDSSKLTPAKKAQDIAKIEAMTQKHLDKLEEQYKKHNAKAEAEYEKHLAKIEARYEKSEKRIAATAEKMRLALTATFQKLSSAVQAEVNKIIAAIQAAEAAMAQLMSMQAVSGAVGSMIGTAGSSMTQVSIVAPMTIAGNVYSTADLQGMMDQHLQKNVVPALHGALQQPSRTLGK